MDPQLGRSPIELFFSKSDNFLLRFFWSMLEYKKTMVFDLFPPSSMKSEKTEKATLDGVKTAELYKLVWNKWDKYILFSGYVLIR